MDELAKLVIDKNSRKTPLEGADRIKFLNAMGNYLKSDLGVDTSRENWLEMSKQKALYSKKQARARRSVEHSTCFCSNGDKKAVDAIVKPPK